MNEWYGLVKKYRQEILASACPDDHSMYPETFKKREGERFYRCSVCGKEHPRFFFDSEFFEEYQICNACLDMPSEVSYKCVDCGRTFIYKNRTALFHKRMKETDGSWKKQRHCPECKAKMEVCTRCGGSFPVYQHLLEGGLCKECRSQAVFKTSRCIDCGSSFSITYGEKYYYDHKGFNYPRRCSRCRGRR